MKISLNEIWNFSDLIRTDEKGWSYKLIAGEVIVDSISQNILQELRSDKHYDTELLPSIFTFREILWQPDVFTESVSSLPGLRILKAHCEEIMEAYIEAPSSAHWVYGELLRGISIGCGEAVDALEAGNSSVSKVLGEFRTAVFPIIKFFIFHPQNRLDYYRDAVNRLNYAVKIMLTQFHGKYTELTDPYWEVIYDQPKSSEKPSKNRPKEQEKS